MEERNPNTWEEFEAGLDDVRQDYEGSDTSAKPSLLFRGQEDSCWLLQSTLDRHRERMLYDDYYRMIANIHPQIETLTGKEWQIESYPEIRKELEGYAFSERLWGARGGVPAYAYMAYLRHHGFPSPLLDWSRSPYVAAYFAFKKAHEDSSHRVSIYVLGQVQIKIHGNGMPVLYRPGPYVRTHRRHVLQQSEYTLCTGFEDQWFFERYDTVFESGPRQQGLCWKFTIPATERTKVLKVLDAYNLNAFSLFESEESLMETLAVREFDFQEESS